MALRLRALVVEVATAEEVMGTARPRVWLQVAEEATVDHSEAVMDQVPTGEEATVDHREEAMAQE